MKKRILAAALLTALIFSACQTAAAKQADKLIAAIGEVTLKSEYAIEIAEKAVQELSVKEVASLKNYSALTAARAEYEFLLQEEAEREEQKKAHEEEQKAREEEREASQAEEDRKDREARIMEEEIDALTVTKPGDLDQIDRVKKDYEALDPDIRARVQNAYRISEAYETYNQLVADYVVEKIEAIGPVTVDSGRAIGRAREAYDLLEEKYRPYVSNYHVLTEAEAEFHFKKAERVDLMIAAIGTVTVESKGAITAAEDAYNALSDEEKSMVKGYDVLVAAHQAYTDSVLAKREADQQAARQSFLDEARSRIHVTGIWTSKPLRDGGFEVYFNFINMSPDKTIKFVNFTFVLHNAAGEVVRCEKEQTTYYRGYIEGPFAPGEGLSGTDWYWGEYYNDEIAGAVLTALSVDYEDGSSYLFTSDQVAYVQY